MINEILQNYAIRVGAINWKSDQAKALTAIYEIGLQTIGAASHSKYNTSHNLCAKQCSCVFAGENNLKASQRKAWAKACGVAEK